MLFDHNFSLDGGALALYSESSLRLHNNVSIKFQENSARTKGGAIYQMNMNDNDIVSPLCAIKDRATNTVEYRVSARHRVSAHPIIFSLEGNSSLLRTISGMRPPIDFSG